VDIGRMHYGGHQQALGIDEDVLLRAFNILAVIEARPTNAPPPFA
jgi:hypothetical protein